MWYNNQTSAFYFFSLRTGIWIIIGLDLTIGACGITAMTATLGFLGLRSLQSKFIFAMWILDSLLFAEFAVFTPLTFFFQMDFPTWTYATPATYALLWFYFGCIEYSYHNVLLRQEQDAVYTNAAQSLLIDPNSKNTVEQEVQGQPVEVQKVQEPLAILEPMVQEEQVPWEQDQGQQVQGEQSQEQPAQWEWEPAEEQPVQEQQSQGQQVQWQFSQGQQEFV